jgi:hypothetical protein
VLVQPLPDSLRTNLAGLSPIPPSAAVSADLGFILIAINFERVVIITIRWRIPRMVKELDLFESNHGCGLNALSREPLGTEM